VQGQDAHAHEDLLAAPARLVRPRRESQRLDRPWLRIGRFVWRAQGIHGAL
jgi:hypothetical protein